MAISQRRWRKPLKVLGIIILAALVALVASLLWLIVPITPSSARSLRFAGYVALPDGPHGDLVKVQDYLTIAGGKLFVAGESEGLVYKLPLTKPEEDAGETVETFGPGPALHGVAFDPASGHAFVTRSDANTVEEFDPGTMKAIRSIPVADDPDGIFFVPGAKLMYVAGGDSRQATLIDPATEKAVGSIPLAGKPEFAAYDDKTHLLYQNIEDGNLLLAIDVAGRQIVGRWPVAGCERPTGLAFDPVVRRLFVACVGNSKLVVFDPDHQRVVTVIPVGGQPDAVAYDQGLHRIYSTGRPGKLTVIQQKSADRYEPLDTIRTHYGAHTLAVDPASHRVFVAYASLLTNARVAVFEAVP